MGRECIIFFMCLFVVVIVGVEVVVVGIVNVEAFIFIVGILVLSRCSTGGRGERPDICPEPQPVPRNHSGNHTPHWDARGRKP
jgi:hypothetical protein